MSGRPASFGDPLLDDPLLGGGPSGGAGAPSGPGLFDVLRRRKWLILFFAAVGAGVGYLAFSKQEPEYYSFAKVSILSTTLPTEDGDARGRETTASTRAQEMVGSRVLGLAVRQHDLGAVPGLGGGGGPLGRIAQRLKVEPAQGADAIELHYYGKTPEEPPAVLGAVLESYEDWLSEGEKSSSGRIVEFMTQARTELAQEIEQLRREYRELRISSPLRIEQGGAVNRHTGMMAELDASRAAIDIDLERLRGRLEAIERQRETDGNAAALSLLVDDLQREDGRQEGVREKSMAEQLFPLVRELELLKDTFGPKHPRLKEVEKQIALTRSHLEATLGPDAAPATAEELLDLYLDKLRLELITAETEKSRLDERYDAESKLANVDLQSELELNDLNRRIELVESLYEATVAKIADLNLPPEDFRRYQVRTLTDPTAAAASDRLLPAFLGLGGVVGLLLGFGLAFLLENLDDRFRDPEELRGELGLPVLAHVPTFGKRALAQVADGPIDPAVRAFHRPASRLAENYRAVRTSVLHGPHGKGLKLIQVTSPDPGDGKSTLAANLAVSLATSGRKTLLLEADFRRPQVHRLFGLGDGPGVCSVLRDHAEWSEAAHPTQVARLWVMPCGRKPSHPAELLSGDRFRELLAVLRDEYEVIVVDTPPVLAVTDPLVVAPLADGVVLTTRLDAKSRRKCLSTLERLESVGAKMLGVVINGVAAGGAFHGKAEYRYDGYGGYAYSYGSGYGSSEKSYDRYYDGAADGPGALRVGADPDHPDPDHPDADAPDPDRPNPDAPAVAADPARNGRTQGNGTVSV